MGSRWQELGGAASPHPSAESAGPPAPLRKRWPGLAATPQRAGGDRFPCPDPGGGRETSCQAGGGGQLPSGGPERPSRPPCSGKARSARSVPGLTPETAALEEAGVT